MDWIKTRIDKWIYAIEIKDKYPWDIYKWILFYNWEECQLRIKMKDLIKFELDLKKYIKSQERRSNKDWKQFTSKFWWWPIKQYIKNLDYLYW